MEIPEPLLDKESIAAAIRLNCCADEEMMNHLDFSLLPHPQVTPLEARTMVLLSWSFLRPWDRPFVFPCTCCMFIPHVHDHTSGCGPSLVYVSEWPPGEGHPRPRIEGVPYHFGNLN